jgi:hypothetical protein
MNHKRARGFETRIFLLARFPRFNTSSASLNVPSSLQNTEVKSNIDETVPLTLRFQTRIIYIFSCREYFVYRVAQNSLDTRENMLDFVCQVASAPPCIHTCIHAYTHKCIHKYLRPNLRTSIDPYIHTYIHTYVFDRKMLRKYELGKMTHSSGCSPPICFTRGHCGNCGQVSLRSASSRHIWT